MRDPKPMPRDELEERQRKDLTPKEIEEAKQELHEEGYVFDEMDANRAGGAAVVIGTEKEREKVKRKAEPGVILEKAAANLRNYIIERRKMVATAEEMTAMVDAAKARIEKSNEPYWKADAAERSMRGLKQYELDDYSKAISRVMVGTGPGNFGVIKKGENDRFYTLYYHDYDGNLIVAAIDTSVVADLEEALAFEEKGLSRTREQKLSQICQQFGLLVHATGDYYLTGDEAITIENLIAEIEKRRDSLRA